MIKINKPLEKARAKVERRTQRKTTSKAKQIISKQNQKKRKTPTQNKTEEIVRKYKKELGNDIKIFKNPDGSIREIRKFGSNPFRKDPVIKKKIVFMNGKERFVTDYSYRRGKLKDKDTKDLLTGRKETKIVDPQLKAKEEARLKKEPAQIDIKNIGLGKISERVKTPGLQISSKGNVRIADVDRYIKGQAQKLNKANSQEKGKIFQDYRDLYGNKEGAKLYSLVVAETQKKRDEARGVSDEEFEIVTRFLNNTKGGIRSAESNVEELLYKKSVNNVLKSTGLSELKYNENIKKFESELKRARKVYNQVIKQSEVNFNQKELAKVTSLEARALRGESMTPQQIKDYQQIMLTKNIGKNRDRINRAIFKFRCYSKEF